MAQLVVNPEQIRARIKELGLSERAVAQKMGLAQSKLSLSLNGKRDFSFAEAKALSAAIGMSFLSVIEAFGFAPSDPQDYVLNVFVKINDEDEMVPDIDGAEQISPPFVGYEGIAIRIDTDGYSPRFKRGEYIGSVHPFRVSPFKWPAGLKVTSWMIKGSIRPAALVGQEVLAAYRPAGADPKADATMGLKILQQSADGAFVLSSLQPTVPPIIGAKIDVCTPIDWHMPRPVPGQWPANEGRADFEAIREMRAESRAFQRKHINRLRKKIEGD